MQQLWVTAMTRLLSKISMGVAAVLVSASIAAAQTTPATPAPAATTKVAPPAAGAPAVKTEAPAVKGVPKKASTPEGIECSKQADEKKLHGKERKTFRTKCIRDLKKAAGTPAAPAKAAAPAAATPAAAPAAAAPPAAKKN